MAGITKEEKARRDKLAEQGIKVCNKCKEEMPFDKFGNDKGGTYERNNICKTCVKQRYRDNKEYFSQYKKKNKAQIKECKKQHYKENKEYILEQIKQYRQRAEVKARTNKRRREKRKNDSMLKASLNIGSSLRNAFKRKGWRKNTSMQKILGCSREQLILWVGDEPSKEMHIDHVIPQSLANTPDELKLLNHYTNFQLLGASENISKGNRYIRKHNLKRVLAHHPQPDKLKEIVERSNVEII
jgi:hypothetical protein